jgi:release factor glutamine methyltransferase
MKLNSWLESATQELEASNVPTARLDCLVLLEDELKLDKSNILAHPELVLKEDVLAKLNKQVSRRASHEPLAYIRRKSEFYGRDFIVTPDTLEPRPETETMIDVLKKFTGNMHQVRPCAIIDIGTGSGCLAITARLELPKVEVVGVDISVKCIGVAAQNAQKHSADVSFYQGDLLAALPNSIFKMPTTILANLPYVPNEHTINKAAMHEPKLAIFGGPDGLDLYRRMFKQIENMSNRPRYIFTESLPFQHTNLTQIAYKAGYSLKTSEDFIQVFEFN